MKEIDIESFSKLMIEVQDRAVEIACALKAYKKEDLLYVEVSDDEIEVSFSADSYCDEVETSTYFMLVSDLNIDIVAKKKEIEEKRLVEIKRLEEIKKRDDLIEKEKKEDYERAMYLRLREKYEKED